MKTIAMYLPQYHRVKENDEWWGENYTDWVAMDKAEPLFEGHSQPIEPLNGYRYDLLKKETFEWQASLLSKYSVYGLCYYHYWFKDGKKILEKPAENLLRWKEININFCFCWANESWIRSWSNIQNGNVWNSKEECGNYYDDACLLEQKYGDVDDWREHFEYLLPFFKDSRYIKINNSPVFLIYKSNIVPCLREMKDEWNKLAKDYGFSGLYFIGGDDEEGILDAKINIEPTYQFKTKYTKRFVNRRGINIGRYVSYEDIWEEILKEKNKIDSGTQRQYYCGFSSYDDTPRRGNFGSVVFNSSPEKFKLYLTELYAKSAAAGNEFVFINAWNEWGEGMYLEPDVGNKFKYLEAFLYAELNYNREVYKYLDNYTKKENDLMIPNIRIKKENYIMSELLKIYEKGKNNEVLKALDGKIAIYGLGVVGRHLIQLLINYKLDFRYAIDRNAKNLHMPYAVYSLEDKMPDVDVVVVTVVDQYDTIKIY